MSAPRPRILGIRARFAIPIATVVLVTGLSLALFIHGTVAISFEEELHRRSHAMVSELVQRSTPEAVRNDLAALDLVAQDISARQDVAYVAIIGASGEVLASSFPAGVPTDLTRIFETPRARPDDELAFRTDDGEVHDLAGQLIDGRLGTIHLGLRQGRIREEAARQSHLVMAHTAGGALVATLLAILTAHLVTRPLRALAAATDQVGTDQPVQIPPVRRGDELGQLAQAFEDMVRRLEQKQAQIDAANRMVVQAERMAVVGQLAAGVAHEIGNPLHAGRQFLEGLEDDPSQAERYLGLLNQALGRIDKVIGQLLSYSSERSLELEPTPVEEVIRQAIDFMRYDQRVRAVEIEPRIEPHLPMAVVDPSVMQQVLVNLLVNALDALDGIGHIDISAELVTHDGGPMVLLAVEDSGPGVPADVAEHLFDPFFTTKDPGKGTGLGLSVSQELVAAQGGSLRYRPSEDGGARFEILLPAQEEA
jgi:two-component system, NtrC family, sensor kinase